MYSLGHKCATTLSPRDVGNVAAMYLNVEQTLCNILRNTGNVSCAQSQHGTTYTDVDKCRQMCNVPHFIVAVWRNEIMLPTTYRGLPKTRILLCGTLDHLSNLTSYEYLPKKTFKLINIYLFTLEVS